MMYSKLDTRADLVPIHGGLAELVDRRIPLAERSPFIEEAERLIATSIPHMHTLQSQTGALLVEIARAQLSLAHADVAIAAGALATARELLAAATAIEEEVRPDPGSEGAKVSRTVFVQTLQLRAAIDDIRPRTTVTD